VPDLFLYAGEPNPFDVRLSDPTTQSGGTGVDVSVVGAESDCVIGAVIVSAESSSAPDGISCIASAGTVTATGSAEISGASAASALVVGTVTVTTGSEPVENPNYYWGGAIYHSPRPSIAAKVSARGLAARSVVGSVAVTCGSTCEVRLTGVAADVGRVSVTSRQNAAAILLALTILAD
jgi:hypothetical protein